MSHANTLKSEPVYKQPMDQQWLKINNGVASYCNDDRKLCVLSFSSYCKNHSTYSCSQTGSWNPWDLQRNGRGVVERTIKAIGITIKPMYYVYRPQNILSHKK